MIENNYVTITKYLEYLKNNLVGNKYIDSLKAPDLNILLVKWGIFEFKNRPGEFKENGEIKKYRLPTQFFIDKGYFILDKKLDGDGKEYLQVLITKEGVKFLNNEIKMRILKI